MKNIQMKYLRCIGDIHGLYERYYSIASNAEYSIQLGDFGLSYDKLIESDLNPQKHKICFGNHENYDKFTQVPHGLISYGHLWVGPFQFFYTRGGFSIDKRQRIEDEEKYGIKSWYKNEELTEEESIEAIELYKEKKPRLMISHDCPTEISQEVGSPEVLRIFNLPGNLITPTQETLQCMFEEFQPELWVFAHYHKNWTLERNGTLFVCVKTLDYIDVDEDLNIRRSQ